MNFFDFADSLKKYPTSQLLIDLNKELQEDEIIAELQRQQWERGEDSEGRIMGLYSEYTELITDGRKQAGDPYNLFDTGDFYEKTKLIADIKSDNVLFAIDSSSVHSSILIKDLSERIFGLQEKNKNRMTEMSQNFASDLLSKNLKIK